MIRKSSPAEDNQGSKSSEESKKSRVPITLKPSLNSTSQNQSDSAMLKASDDGDKSDKTLVVSATSDVRNKLIKDILSSSISSTNIMDTSETPVTMNGVEEDAHKVTKDIEALDTATEVVSERSTSTSSTVPPTTSLPHRYPDPVFYDVTTVSPKHFFSTNSKTGQCPVKHVRFLDWPWTRPGTAAVLACPQGSSGLARWECQSEGDWSTAWPDLSQCRSHWLSKLHQELRRQESVVHLAKDTLHHLQAQPLYGGDLSLLTRAIRVMTSRLRSELPLIPTGQQRAAVTTEVVQGLVQSASVAVSEEEAWRDLGAFSTSAAGVALAEMIDSLEQLGLLVPGAVGSDQEVTVASDNICKSSLFFLSSSGSQPTCQYFYVHTHIIFGHDKAAQ